MHAAWLATVGVWNKRLGSQKLPGGTLEAQRQMWSYVKSEIVVSNCGDWQELVAKFARDARDKADEWMVTSATRLQAAGIKIIDSECNFLPKQ